MEAKDHLDNRTHEIDSFELNVLESVRNGLYRYYRPEGSEKGEMPFHNLQHAINTEAKVIDYIQYVNDNGIEVDAFSLRFAALMHDAGFYEDVNGPYFKLPITFNLKNERSTSHDLKNKEEYSAWLADILAQSYGIEEDRRDKISRLILCTASSEAPNTVEEKIICRADLDNISGPHTSFFTNTLKLVREAEILSGSDNPFEVIFKLRAILEEYISKDLCLGDFDKEVYDHFFRHPALANITRITSMNIHSTIKSLGEAAFKLLPSLKRDSQS